MHAGAAFADDDWRSGSPAFQGNAFSRNLEVVDQLRRFATEELGCSVAQLAVAWTLANPAVNVAIVGARHPNHIEDSLAAAGCTSAGRTSSRSTASWPDRGRSEGRPGGDAVSRLIGADDLEALVDEDVHHIGVNWPHQTTNRCFKG